MTDTTRRLSSAAWAAQPDNETLLLQLIADGLHDHQIAARLGVADHSVKKMVISLLNRWKAGDRTHLVYLACRRGRLTVGMRRCGAGSLTPAEFRRQRTVLSDRLTARQAAVLPLLAKGFTDAAIGREIGRAQCMVIKYVAGARRVLDATDRTNLVYKACWYGLLPLGDTNG